MKFFKMHGCGNDFVVIDYQENVDYAQLAIKLCNRKTGIGADGLIAVKQGHLEMIFYNQDGSRASMCGNGIRCFARYVYENKYVNSLKFDVLTLAGTMKIEIKNLNPFTCRVDMGLPIFTNQMINVSDCLNSFGRIVEVDGYNLTLYSFYMGTVHTVVFVDSLESQCLSIAEKICKHKIFKKQTNVNFVHIINDKTIEMRTFERGVGWTLACGTGACASVVCANKLGLVANECRVLLELGHLDIIVNKKGILMDGPAEISFIGDFKEE